MEDCTENLTGLNLVPKTRASSQDGAVGKRSMCTEAVSARNGGAHGSENVGISNKKLRKIRNHRKSKVSWATHVAPGLVGPKARPKGVVDG
jgi:hypothetical protein